MSKSIPGNNKHLTLSDRSYIEVAICKGESFISISKYLCKDPSTIGREVLKHRILDKSQFKSKFNNYCAKRFTCEKTHICISCYRKYYKNVRCATCSKCNINCKDFVKETCARNTSAPYVCNGCHKQKNCKLNKYFYIATKAHKNYINELSETRQGINISESKLALLDSKVSPLIVNGLSPYQIIETYPEINCTAKTLYNYIDNGYLSVKNIDLPKKIRYKVRKSHNKRVNNQAVFFNKTYEDFLLYISKHPKEEIVEMDSVIGCEGSTKVLLTFLFRSSRLMLAFLLDRLHYLNVVEIFDFIEYNIGTAPMYDLMPIILTDRGFEFTHPKELEYGINELKRTKIFYCNSMSAYQKGRIEKNHEYIRKFFPKGSTFDNLTQDDINLMLSHINSSKRKILDNKCPIEVFLEKQNDLVLNLLDIKQIESDKIILNKNLFDK